MKKNCALLFAFFFCLASYSQNASMLTRTLHIPDSSSIRSSLIETWFESPASVALENRAEIRTNEYGEYFQVRCEEHDTTFSIIVAPRVLQKVNVYHGEEVKEDIQYIYPENATGSWVLTRNKRTGMPQNIRYYVAVDKNVYIQFTPSNNTTYADFVVYENYVSRQVPTSFPFQRFYTLSIREISSITQNSLPWNYANPFLDAYSSSIKMVEEIRSRLTDLIYADNAMYDEYGKAIYITSGEPRPIHATDARKKSLSSAGFVKWIADGLVYPITKNYLKREPLIRPTVQYDEISYKGVLSTKHSLSFSLDWTRNIAAAILSLYTGRTYLYEDSGVDMTEEPFVASFTKDGVKSALGYIKNCGYEVAGLPSLMYSLATKYPGEFYLVAIYETDRRVQPEVKMFNQCAAIFPYFDSNGVFRCVVFRNGAEFTLSEFCKSFSTDFVHLTRVRSSERFSLP
ncbi:MAG: hypothetical protein IJR49_05955 [Treponema sp.]|nr:hypothetical protein [Treponema sp.]